MADKLDLLIAVCSDALKAEQETTDRLTGKAEKYLAAIGVVLAFQVVKVQELSFRGSLTRVMCSVSVLVGLVLLLASMATALLSMRARAGPTFPRSEDLQLLGEAKDDNDARSMAAKVYM